jgi:hypothetical protein
MYTPDKKINACLSINMQNNITCLTDTKEIIKCFKSKSHSEMGGKCRKTFTARRVTCISILFTRLLCISDMPYMPITKVSSVLLLEHRHCGCESSSARGCCVLCTVYPLSRVGRETCDSLISIPRIPSA